MQIVVVTILSLCKDSSHFASLKEVLIAYINNYSQGSSVLVTSPLSLSLTCITQIRAAETGL